MNKLLAIIAVLFLGTIAMQAQNSASSSAACSTSVIRSLSIDKNQDLDFGKVAQGVTESIQVTDARAVKFTILGEDLENVTISYSAPSSLIHTNGTSSLALTSYVKSNSTDAPGGAADISSGATVSLNSSGNYYVYLGGEVSPSASQDRGLYTADFTIDVEY